MVNDVFDNNIFVAILLCKLVISLSLSLSLQVYLMISLLRVLPYLQIVQ